MIKKFNYNIIYFGGSEKGTGTGVELGTEFLLPYDTHYPITNDKVCHE